jgi:hypothetical protein
VAETARAGAPATAKTPQFFKAGTIERFVQWRGAQDGKRLHALSKVIGVSLLGHARADRGFTCVVSEPELCDELAMDPKTFRKYLAPLVEFGLVKTDRSREGAAKRYDLSEIYRRFGEQRSEPGTKVTELQTGTASRSAVSDRESVPEVRETIPVRPGNGPGPDRESLPVSIKVFPSSISSFTSSLLDVSAPAARLGLRTTESIEREIVTIDEILTRWAFPERRQRQLVKRSGVVAVAGAIGYVLQQQHLNPGAIEKPDGLFIYALREGFSAELPAEQTGKVSRSAETPRENARSLGDAVKTYLEARLTDAVYQAFFVNARFVITDNCLRVECVNLFTADFIRSRHLDAVCEAMKAISGRSEVTVDIVAAD